MAEAVKSGEERVGIINREGRTWNWLAETMVAWKESRPSPSATCPCRYRPGSAPYMLRSVSGWGATQAVSTPREEGHTKASWSELEFGLNLNRKSSATSSCPQREIRRLRLWSRATVCTVQAVGMAQCRGGGCDVWCVGGWGGATGLSMWENETAPEVGVRSSTFSFPVSTAPSGDVLFAATCGDIIPLQLTSN